MNQTTITAVICLPGETAKVQEISSTLPSLQSLVGGCIELYYLTDSIALICNDSGKLDGLPVNRTIKNEFGNITEIICGPMLIVDASGEEFASLSHKDIEKYLKMFHYPEEVYLYGSGLVSVCFDPENDFETVNIS